MPHRGCTHCLPDVGEPAVQPPLSSTGKSHLLGNTGGFTDLPDVEGVRVNVVVARKVGAGTGQAAYARGGHRAGGRKPFATLAYRSGPVLPQDRRTYLCETILRRSPNGP